MPYFGYTSEKIRGELTRLFKSYYPQVDIKLAFTNSFTVGSFFRFKDNLPVALSTSFIYKFSCSECHSEYVGSSIRHFKARVSEHLGISYRTGRRLNVESKSAPRDHCRFGDHAVISSENFKILNKSKDPHSLRILESLYILKLKPKLNDYQSAVPLEITH